MACHCCSNPSLASSSSVSQVDEQLAANRSGGADVGALTNVRLKAATLDNPICQRTGFKGIHLPDCSYSRLRPRRASARLHPSPSSASSRSNTSSLFRDDGFEDDLTSTASERTSSCHQGSGASTSSSGASSTSNNNNANINHQHYFHPQHHRNSIGYLQRNHHHRLSYQDRGSISSRQQYRLGEDDDEYQSCYEEGFSNSQTTASTASNLDDCALSTTSSSVIHHDQQTFFDDKLSLAEAKQQYRKSLLLEHEQLQQQRNDISNNHLNQSNASQSKIQSLLLTSPQACRHHLFASSAKGPNNSALRLALSDHQNGHSNVSPVPASSNGVIKQGKLDDRTVNIIGHMATRSPGYWDSNLSITQRVVTEIVETERTYVDDLELIVTGYICYLRNIIKQQKQLKQHRQKQQQKQSQPIQIAINNIDNHQDKDGIITCHNQNINNNANVSNNAIQESRTFGENMTDNSLDHEGAHGRQFRGCVSVISRSADDDKSMMIFDDDIVGGEVDEYDVEEANDDLMGNYSRRHSHQNGQIQLDNHYRHSHIDCHHHVSLGSPREKISSEPCAEDKLDQDLDAGAVMTAGYLKKLFSNLEDIYKFNKDLLFRLEECYLNPSSVAECFVENAAGFEVYTQYCTMYPQVVSTLTELMSNPSSAQLLRQRQNKLNQCLPLGAYLLKPVQRILKYHILFQSLIKHTNDDDTVDEKDRQLISEAFSVMTSIACHINAMKKRHEHAIRVQEVQGLLSDWEGPDLTTLGELILEDTFKLYHRPKSTRHLLLFDNVLLITKKKSDGSLSYKGHIACSNLMLIENIEGQPLVFETVPFDNPKALLAFQSKNLDKKRDWCLHMKEVIIKSFEVKIPVHVRDILMSLTINGSTEQLTTKSSSETNRALKAPSYLQRRSNKDKKKG